MKRMCCRLLLGWFFVATMIMSLGGLAFLLRIKIDYDTMQRMFPPTSIVLSIIGIGVLWEEKDG